MNTMRCPRCTSCIFFVDDNLCPWWCKWRPVEVELTFDKTVTGEFRKKIQGEFGLFQEIIPLMQGEIRVCAADTRNKIIFKGADTSFCSVSSVIVQWNELNAYVILKHASLECCRRLVFKQL